MSNNAKLKHLVLFAAAILLPPLVGRYVDASGVLPAAVFSSLVIGVLAASASIVLPLLIPVGVYGLGCLVYGGDFIIPAIPVMLFPAGLSAGLCMRRRCSRRLTVALTSASFLLGLAGGFALLTYSLCGALSVGAISDTYNLLYVNATNALYTSVYNVLNKSAQSYGLEEADVSAYAVAYIRSYKPMFFGTLLMASNIASYVFTAISGRFLRYLNAEKYRSLPGISGNWEFVLSKSSAVVFILCYVCLFLGGETLTLPQASAFYAVMLAIVGGVFLMAFRALRTKMNISISNILIIGVILLLFFNGSILDIATIILAIIGLVATFKQDKKEAEKQ